jgi:hypothetical protein
MMAQSLGELLSKWDETENDPNIEPGTVRLVLYLAEKLYSDYEPDALRPFYIRLEKWLSNLSNETDQKVAFNLLSYLFFAGRGEFESLYRTAMWGIYQWIIQIDSLDIKDNQLSHKLSAAVDGAWICPITDSLRINAFLKINKVVGHDHRPHWRSLAKFGDVTKISAYMATNNITKVAMLEDFVGTGSQIESTVEFACANFPDIDFLVCPLVICPQGDELLERLAAKHNRLSYFPALVLPKTSLLTPAATPGEPAAFGSARDLINRESSRLGPNRFGYRDTGALVVLFSNCPDNTLAVFREENADWQPLFPRIWRPE